MNIKGKIHSIGSEQVISEKFKARKFVVMTSDQYPQYIELQLVNDRADLIEPYAVGREIDCSINLRGRLWTDAQGVEKCFNTLECWKIQSAGESQPPPAPSLAPLDGQVDDLPF